MFSTKSLLAITLGVVICIIFNAFVTKSPYAFGAGLAMGVFLSDANTTKRGAIYGSIISALVSLYLALSNSLPGEGGNSPLFKYISIILFICFGSLYGAALIWIRNLIEKGDRPFF